MYGDRKKTPKEARAGREGTPEPTYQISPNRSTDARATPAFERASTSPYTQRVRSGGTHADESFEAGWYCEGCGTGGNNHETASPVLLSDMLRDAGRRQQEERS